MCEPELEIEAKIKADEYDYLSGYTVLMIHLIFEYEIDLHVCSLHKRAVIEVGSK